jgi:hypothetical protein
LNNVVLPAPFGPYRRAHGEADVFERDNAAEPHRQLRDFQ